MDLIQKDTTTLIPQKLLSIVYLLSLISYLTDGNGNKVLGFPTLNIDSVHQGGIFTLKLIWDNSWASLIETLFP